MKNNDPILHSLFSIRTITALAYSTVGLFHFLRPEPFVRIVPPVLPAPRALVYLSGAAEIAGGLGLLVPQLRKVAGWGLIALTIAVYPANIYMALEEIYLDGMPRSRALLWGRLPFQFLFLGMVWLSMQDGE